MNNGCPCWSHLNCRDRPYDTEDISDAVDDTAASTWEDLQTNEERAFEEQLWNHRDE